VNTGIVNVTVTTPGVSGFLAVDVCSKEDRGAENPLEDAISSRH
jgi:hypothetical protein